MISSIPKLRFAALCVALAIAALAGCATESAEDASEPSAEVTEGAGAPEHRAPPAEEPSALPIMVHWQSEVDGAQPISELSFDLENTLPRDLDVVFHVSSTDRGRTVEITPRPLRVKAKSSVAQSVPVSELGVQLVGASVVTRVYVTYRDLGAPERESPLFPVWITHEPGFEAAFVRSSTREAEHNGPGVTYRTKALAVSGRVRSEATGRFEALPPDVEDTASPSRTVLTTLPEELAELPPQQWPSFDEPQLPLVPGGEAGAVAATDKAGNFVICPRVQYLFADAALGEDHLASGWGITPARRFAVGLFDPSGALKYWGFLNSSGCSGSLAHVNGTWTAMVAPAVYDSAKSVSIEARVDQATAGASVSKTYNISGTGGTITLDMVAITPVLNAAIVGSNSLHRANEAFTSNTSVKLLAEVTCSAGDLVGSACFAQPSTVLLGPAGANHVHKTLWKTIIAHELGHWVQFNLFGTLSTDYTLGSGVELCRCDHVDTENTSNDSHCLQGKERIGPAQGEGFGHFFAADSYNNGSETDCTFGYYKEFLETTGGTPTPVPVAKSCSSKPRWMEKHCTSTNAGVEWDWMNFYWTLHTKTSSAFSYANIRSVYRSACGNASCAGANVTWPQLQTAVNATFGSSSARALYWAQTGVDFGVDH